MKKLCMLLTLMIGFSSLDVPLKAQIVFENPKNEVYRFLERISQKGIIDFADLIKPLSKIYIAQKLAEARNRYELLTDLEKSELEYFERNYFIELNGFKETSEDHKHLSYFDDDPAARWRFFSYSEHNFKFMSDLHLGFNLGFTNKVRAIHSWMGISSYSYLLDNIGISLNFRTNNEKGDQLDISKEFTPVTGIIPEVHDFGRDMAYTDVRSSISYDWDWGDLIIAKDFIQYGYERFGKLVLSDKAPSFPYIRLDLKPVDWFNFTYFHAWLSSLVVDSIKLQEYNRDIFRNKYFAWHALTITPFKGFDFTLGESVIYSDRLELPYLMPFMFFYFADDYISNRNGKPGDANQQIFISLSSKNHLKNVHFFSTLFVDELTIGGINGSLFINPTYGGATARRQRTQLGYTFGLSVTGLPLENLTVAAEYTRINPFVYGHHDTAQTYTNSGYLLGHWMGHNSDLFYFDLNYRLFRGLQVDFWGAFIRKGSNDYSRQYIQPEPIFLFGLRTNYSYLGLNIKYELMHELNIESRLKFTTVSSEQSDGTFIEDKIEDISLSIYYGL